MKRNEVVIKFDTNDAESYRLFLRVKSLPAYRIEGRTAIVPREYAKLLGLTKAKTTEIAYGPSPFLFDYQSAITRLALRRRKFAVFADCGLGKTLVILEWCKAVAAHARGRILIVSPLMVVRQTAAETKRFYGDSLPVEVVSAAALPAWLESSGDAIGLTNYEAIREGLPRGRLAALVLDECFAKGTPVDCVEEGALVTKDIENVQCGDRIVNAAGVDVVSDVHRREVPYAVVVDCGTRITCSPNHPFFTQRGWVGAQDLEPGDAVASTEAAVRMVQDAVRSGGPSGTQQVLQSILLSEVADESSVAQGQGAYGGNACEDRRGPGEVVVLGQPAGCGRTGSNRGIEPDVRSGGSAKSLPPIESDPPQTFRAWGQRDWFDSASEDTSGCARADLGAGVLFVTGATSSRLSHALQARLGEQRLANRHRGGWSLASLPEGERPEEGCQAGFTRVDGVKILEPGCPELERLRDADGKLYFYDLGGTRHPSFSVSGLLVHNSSMLKSHYGAWGQRLIELGRGLEWKLCLTGTPAPNDRIEYANHAVFLDAFPTVNSFLAKFFVNRGMTGERWELKPHALRSFYRALSHWCIFLADPVAYGWRGTGRTIPPLRVYVHDVALTDEQENAAKKMTGSLFAGGEGGSFVRRGAMSRLAKGVAADGSDVPTLKFEFVRDLVESWPEESTIVWANFNAEQDRLEETFPDAASIRGETPYDERSRLLEEFQSGKRRVLISKPKVLGFGLNLQIATRQVFSSLTDSYESYYQAVKRSNRIGSMKALDVHIPVTDVERPGVENVLRKAAMVARDSEEQQAIFKECAGDFLS